MDWEYLFADRIIERGYSYYCSCAVKNLTVTDDTMQANEQQRYMIFYWMFYVLIINYTLDLRRK